MPSRTSKMNKEPLSEGRRSVAESLKNPSSVDKVLVSKNLTKSRPINELLETAKKYNIPIEFKNDADLDKISHTGKHQGILAYLVSEGYYPEILFWETLINNDSNFRLLILDGIQDPHNFGAISRSALAFGIDYIVIPKKRSVGITSGSIRASSGAIHNLNIIRVPNISNFINKLKKFDFWIVGLKSGSGKSVKEHKFSKRVSIVIGSEHDGISKKVESQIDIFTEITIKKDKIESLNASVAASIVMFELFNSD
ncbi:MAG: 23S rRNA (guanosine(2251)-2'-O)-methyltransferase RlmB [Chloroflexi bacterium]|nr:23S rRNA (guanosine(2251)-2'-O)-methyltransferase RlmB [Chloroflexota bacterium]|tara:strand:+ start:2184 stop:2945 length:762 start_codon:yes stop_codon:yes gene_type:complete